MARTKKARTVNMEAFRRSLTHALASIDRARRELGDNGPVEYDELWSWTMNATDSLNSAWYASGGKDAPDAPEDEEEG